MDKYTLWYGNIKGIGHRDKLRIAKPGLSPAEVYYMKYGDLREIFGEKATEKIIISRKLWELEGEWESLEKKKISYVTILDEEYPSRIMDLMEDENDIPEGDSDNQCDTERKDKKYTNIPFGLYFKGNLPDDTLPSVAVVGARQCTPYGEAVAGEIGRILGENSVQVISGLARGIDGIAQRGAFDAGGETFGVLGCGVDICYPPGNIDLYMELEKKGGLISEQPPGMKPLAPFFPARNRIISALSDLVIVVEAKRKSGSLITADMALEQGRDVIAVPGRVTDKTSEGCNLLISQGAEIYAGPETLEERIGEIAASRDLTCSFDAGDGGYTPFSLNEREKQVYKCIDYTPTRLEDILAGCGLTFTEAMGIIMDLEMKGCIKELTRNTYSIAR